MQPITEDLSHLVAEVTGLAPATITITLRPPLDFQSNRLYDAWAGGRHLIIKEYLKPEEFEEAPVREFQALRLLAPLDIAPQPLFFQPHTLSRGPLVIYDYMPGEMWNRRRPTAPELAQLAAINLQINAVSAGNLWLSRASRPAAQVVASFRASFEAYSAWVEAEFAPGRQAAEWCLGLLEPCQAVANELAAYTPPLYFCRADPRFANVIRRPGGHLGLVDWEDSGLCDPARELADMVTHPNQEDLLPWPAWQAFLQPYMAVRAKTDAYLADRFRLYLALFPVFWLTILIETGLRRLKAGQSATWLIDGRPANEKLQRYLARALAWPAPDGSSQPAAALFFPAAN